MAQCRPPPYDVMLKTFMRPEKLEKCLASIQRLNPPPQRVVVADDGPESPEKERVYKAFDGLPGFKLLRLEFDAGISRSRNQAFKHTSAPYVLLIDDDHYLPTNIFELHWVLEADPMLGGVSPFWEEYGVVFCGASDIHLGSWIIRDVERPKQVYWAEPGLHYLTLDLIPNTTLFRRECLQDLAWDEAYIIGGEHLDFYVCHKKLGRWRFAVTPNLVVSHDPKSLDQEYNRHRTSREKGERSTRYFLEKHGVKGFLTLDVLLPKDRSTAGTFRRALKKRLAPRWLLWQLQNQGFWYDYRTRRRARKPTVSTPSKQAPGSQSG